MGRKRGWTPAKRRLARAKASAALRCRRRLVEQVRGRKDTAFAGFLPVAVYMRKALKLRKQFRRKLHMSKRRNAAFKPQDEAMAVLGRLMLGVKRREHLDQLLPEQAIADALGIRRWPSGDTERRHYLRYSEAGLKGLDQMQERIVLKEVTRKGTGPVHVDGDVTGLISQGEKREGVKAGYMGGSVKPGYQNPRVAVDGIPIWVDLRPGNDPCEDLYREGMRIVRKVRRRAPRCWIYHTLDSKYGKRQNIADAVAYAQRDSRFRFFIGGCKQYCCHDWWRTAVQGDTGRWVRVSKTTEIKDLGLQNPWGPKGPRVRVVAVRKEDWKEKHRKRKRKAPPGEKYRYQVIYTGGSRKKLTAREIFREYHRGQQREFGIKDGKQSFALGNLPVKELRGNRAYVKLCAMAQAIVAIYQRKFLNAKPWGLLGRTMREVTFHVGGKNPDGWSDSAGSFLPGV